MRRKKKENVYLQFIAEWKPQKQKEDMCKLLWIYCILIDESSKHEMGRGVGSVQEGEHTLKPKGEIKGKPL